MSWRDIERIRKCPDEFRALAGRILKIVGVSPWEEIFLESIARSCAEELTNRQGEKLVQIRDDYEFVKDIYGFSVKSLFEKCRLGQVDLSEDDEAWLIERCKQDCTTARRHEARRLLRCARELGLVDT